MAEQRDQRQKHKNSSSADHKNGMNNEKKQKTDQGFDANSFLGLVKKYKNYIAAGVLFLAVVLALVKFSGSSEEAPKEDPVQEEQQQKDLADTSQEFQVDAIPEVNALITDYYSAYQDGNVKALKKLAKPISDKEKSYIKVFSKYVDSYDNISCYTKAGLSEGEYVVSVYLEMKFKDVDTTAPGLDFFYLRTDEDGALYIDNAYSTFNQSKFMEISTQADVQAYINEFEQGEDVVALQKEVQEKYEKAVEEDAKLAEMAQDTIPGVISGWVQSLAQTDSKEETDSDETKSDEAKSDETTSDETDAKKDDAEKTDKKDDASKKDEKTDKDTSDKSEKDDQTADKNKDQTSEKDTDKKSDQTTTEKDKNGKAKTAYAMDGINLRKSASTDAKIVTQIMLGDKLKIYPATEKNGWVKAKYKGKNGYVKREFVTTKRTKVPTGTTAMETKPAKALPAGATITLSESVNVRVSMSETADRVGLAFKGDAVKVIQSYAEGWTKVEWNGQTGYIKTDLIK